MFRSNLPNQAVEIDAFDHTNHRTVNRWRFCLKRFVPLPAVSLASSVNVICMRWNELRTGIEVYENGGKVVGVSKVAAKQAVTNTTLVRAFLPIPLLLSPPCIMPFLERLKWVSGSPVRHLFINAVVCTLSFAASLPVALALFPQEGSVSSSSEMSITFTLKGFDTL
ncbi:unnamed protein product [Angiostrongylus costaricensis]|uniref:Tricarboxylate carrier n=1 Tax=Angiostrongylus costaricensis TaxID=334426 RepID=A0A3P7J3E4_ANGCS|nr:unnamed protein product [Angiostrongylus costaricensis]